MKTDIRGEIRLMLEQEYADIIDDLPEDDDEDVFYGGAALNSFTILSVIVKLETMFGIVIGSEAMRADNFRSINAMTRLVKTHLAGAVRADYDR